MKITSLSQVLELYRQKNIKKDKQINENKKFDEVSISDEAYQKLDNGDISFEEELKSIDMGQLIEDVSQIDHDKVNQLKSKIKSGQYEIDSYKIAGAIIDDDI